MAASPCLRWLPCWHRDSPLRQTVTLSRLAPDMAPLPPRRFQVGQGAVAEQL